MKLAKRILTAGVALALTLGLNIPAFAATITVTNPAAGETYTAYKLFDVTNSGTAYAYSTTNEDLVGALDVAEQAFSIDFEEAATGGVWYVSGLDNEVEAAAMAQYINNHLDDTFDEILGDGITSQLVNVGTEDEPEYKVQINTGDETGYYFVDSTLGSLCVLNTATADVDINEKNTVPTVNKEILEDSKSTLGEYIEGDTSTSGEEYATIDVIDTIYYQLTVNTGTNSTKLGTGIDGDYVIKDVLPAGITFNFTAPAEGEADADDWATGIVVTTGEGDSTTTWAPTTDYTVAYDTATNTLTITLLSTGKLAELAQNTNITIRYNADVTAEQLSTRVEHTNNVTLTYKEQESKDAANFKTYEIGEDANGNKTITKVDGNNPTTTLPGVKFVLSKGTGEDTQYATFDQNHYLTGWVDTQAQATALITDASGNIYAYGLDADTYILTETETLPGYNLLDDTITVVIAENGNVTYQPTSEVGDDNPETNPDTSITIENNAGSRLPSTGGMGTTILYIAGAALVLGAGVTLVVRRRMNSDR